MVDYMASDDIAIAYIFVIIIHQVINVFTGSTKQVRRAAIWERRRE
jgi:hypothetical protein